MRPGKHRPPHHWMCGLVLIGGLGCDASSGFTPNTDFIVQTAVVREMRFLAQFMTEAQMDDQKYLASPFVRDLSLLTAGLPCDLPAATDSNGNGIPDDLTHIFTAANCPVATEFIRGGIRIQDIGGPWGVRVTYNNLQTVLSVAAVTLEKEIAGVLELRQTSDTTLSVSNNTTTMDRNVSSAGTILETRIHNLTFIQTAPITRDAARFVQPLPRRVTVSGSIASVGALGIPEDTIRMAINTTTTLTQTQPFCLGFYSTGELDVRVTGAATSTVGIRFSC